MNNRSSQYWNSNRRTPYSEPENRNNFRQHPYPPRDRRSFSKYNGRRGHAHRPQEGHFVSNNYYSGQSEQKPYSTTNANTTFDIHNNYTSRNTTVADDYIEDSPEKLKAFELMKEVFSQEGVRGRLIFYMSERDPANLVLQNALDTAQIKMQLVGNPSGSFKLYINEEEFGEGSYPSKQNAKSELFKTACEELKKSCFTIVKKDNFEDINTDEMRKTKKVDDFSMCNSKALQMMKNMGWGGKGLGINEQGNEKTVAESLEENISRQGLGSDNVFKKIKSLLDDFAKSDKLTILRFEPDFTSEDREQIHRFAQQLGLKSKSTGKDPNRRLTITKKLNKKLLVEQLLYNNCETHSYKLEIPSRFQHKWSST